jgi:1-phosphofructokinase
MIVTLTPNPSLDRTIEVPALTQGEVIRATGSHVDPGGKGVNVSRAVALHGRSTLAVLPAGGAEGAQLAALLAPQGVPAISIPLAGPTRSNVTLVEPDGTTTKVNEPGPVLSADEAAALADRVVSLAVTADWVVLCGSLPRGVPAAFYADLVQRLKAQRARVAVDTSGAALAHACQAGPDVVKPNESELAEIAGRALPSWRDLVDEANRLRDQGVGQVLISLGAPGVLLVDADGVRHARSAPVEVRSTVGAGDSTLAGFLLGGAKGAVALAHAVAFGTAAVTLPGSGVPGPADLDLAAVVVDADPDLDTPVHPT